MKLITASSVLLVLVLSVSCGKKDHNNQLPIDPSSFADESDLDTPVQVILGAPSEAAKETVSAVTEEASSVIVDVSSEGEIVVTANNEELPAVIETLDTVKEVEVVEVAVVETETKAEEVEQVEKIEESEVVVEKASVQEAEIKKISHSHKLLKKFITKIERRIQTVEKNLKKLTAKKKKNESAIEKAQIELKVLNTLLTKAKSLI